MVVHPTRAVAVASQSRVNDMSMTLLDVIADIARYDAGHTIYAVEPWSPSSVAVVAEEPADGSLPADAVACGANYFLEVDLSTEFIEGWVLSRDSAPDDPARCQRLIEYAVNDA